MVLIHDSILKIDIYNFEMSQITPEKSLKSNQIYSVTLCCSMLADIMLSYTNIMLSYTNLMLFFADIILLYADIIISLC